MRRDDVPLQHMVDIITIHILLYHMYIIRRKKILIKKISRRSGIFLKNYFFINTKYFIEKLTWIEIEIKTTCEVRDVISRKNNLGRCEDINKETEIFLIQNEKYENLLLEVTKMHEAVAKSLWQHELWK